MRKHQGQQQFYKKLNKIIKKLEEIKSRKEIINFNVFTDVFMEKHTQFDSIKSMCEAGGFVINSKNDFKTIPIEKWNLIIIQNTKFQNWSQMLREAEKERIAI